MPLRQTLKNSTLVLFYYAVVCFLVKHRQLYFNQAHFLYKTQIKFLLYLNKQMQCLFHIWHTHSQESNILSYDYQSSLTCFTYSIKVSYETKSYHSIFYFWHKRVINFSFWIIFNAKTKNYINLVLTFHVIWKYLS